MGQTHYEHSENKRDKMRENYTKEEFAQAAKDCVNIISQDNYALEAIKKDYRNLLNQYSFAQQIKACKASMTFTLCYKLQSNLQNILFALLEAEYSFNRVAFIEEIVSNLHSVQEDIKKQTAYLLLEVINNVDDKQRGQVSFTSFYMQDKRLEKVNILELMLPWLDLSEPKTKNMLTPILNWPEVKKWAGIYVKLGLLECKKGQDCAFKMVAFFLLLARRNGESDVGLIPLQVAYYNNVFVQLGYDVTNRVDSEGEKRFIAKWQEIMARVLQKDKAYSHLNFGDLVRYLQSIATVYNFSYRPVVTSCLLENFSNIAADYKPLLLLNRSILLDLETLSIGQKSAEDMQNLANFIMFFWNDNVPAFWQEISSISSALKVSNLFVLVAKYCKKIAASEKDLVEEIIHSNYLLFRAHLRFWTKLPGDRVLDISKCQDLLQKALQGQEKSYSLNVLQELYLTYLNEQEFTLDGSIYAHNIPVQKELDKGFLRFLAKKNSLGTFFGLCNFFIDLPYFSEMVLELQGEFLLLEQDQAAYHYAFFLEQFMEGYDLLKRDQHAFLIKLFNDVMIGIEQGSEEFKILSTKRIRALYYSNSAKENNIAELSDERIIAAVKILISTKQNDSSEVKEVQNPAIVSKNQRKKNYKEKRSIFNNLLLSLSPWLGCQKEDDLYNILGDRKVEDREVNLQNLCEYFLQEILFAKNWREFDKNVQIQRELLAAYEKIISLKGSDDNKQQYYQHQLQVFEHALISFKERICADENRLMELEDISDDKVKIMSQNLAEMQYRAKLVEEEKDSLLAKVRDLNAALELRSENELSLRKENDSLQAEIAKQQEGGSDEFSDLSRADLVKLLKNERQAQEEQRQRSQKAINLQKNALNSMFYSSLCSGYPVHEVAFAKAYFDISAGLVCDNRLLVNGVDCAREDFKQDYLLSYEQILHPQDNFQNIAGSLPPSSSGQSL